MINLIIIKLYLINNQYIIIIIFSIDYVNILNSSIIIYVNYN